MSQVTEVTGADRLEKFRAEQQHFVGLSFPSIRFFIIRLESETILLLLSSVGPNGAIIHYRPTEETARRITRDELYLVDSGAQYRDGTTDVTRTFHYGTPTDEMIDRYTEVLQVFF